MSQIIPQSKVIAVAPAHSLTYDGATLNIFHVDKGQGLPAHNHLYAHATMCMAGSCAVRKEGKELIMTKMVQFLQICLPKENIKRKNYVTNFR